MSRKRNPFHPIIKIKLLLVALAYLAVHPASTEASQYGQVTDRIQKLLYERQEIAQSYSYVGPCGGDIRDSRNYLICCTNGTRPVCYNDGRCNCANYDNQCTSSPRSY